MASMLMTRWMAALLGLSFLLWSAFAWAAPDPAGEAHPALTRAQALFEAGDFVEAASEARKVDTVAASALAARASLAQGDFVARPDERRALFAEAEREAREVVARAPDNPQGHLYLALALGFLGRIDGSMAAHFGGYASEARTHINEAIALDPKSAWAYALEGGWNLEIVRDGGMIGRSLYGASFDKGVQAYRKALELEPGNAAIAYQYAVQLLAAGGTRNRAEAHQVLIRALLPKTENAVERLARRRAKKLEDALDTHNAVTVEAILRVALGSYDEEAARKPLLPGGQH